MQDETYEYHCTCGRCHACVIGGCESCWLGVPEACSKVIAFFERTGEWTVCADA